MARRGDGLFGRQFGSSPQDKSERGDAAHRQPTLTEIEAFRDAMLPRDLGGGDYEVIPADGTPEELADALIRSSLPRVFFDQIDLGTEIGLGQLLAMFVSRPGNASLEKDEIVRFVERNRSQMPEFFGKLLPQFKKAAAATGEERLTKFIEYFGTQAHYAYSNTPEKINIKSGRLLWLIYALAGQVDSGTLSYESALDYLQKPMHYDRISELTLGFKLYDYADSLDKPSRPSLVYLMLIGEAGRIKNIAGPAAAAFHVVAKSLVADGQGHILRFVNHLEPYLAKTGRLSHEDKLAIQRIRGRFATDMKPNDF
jgi:hypothetical protein